MSDNITPFPRIVRPVPEPLGLYLRPGRNDHKEVLDLIAAGDAACFGAVLEPTLIERQSELKDQVLKHRMDAILDPKTQAAATPGGFNDALGALPWGVGRPHVPDDFTGTSGRRLVSALADFVLEHGFTQILAPSHLLQSGDDEWLGVDAEATRRLRNELDRNGGGRVLIIYSLAVSARVFRDPEQRRKLIDALKTVPVGSVWLRVDGFGSDCSPTAARNYLEAASEFHDLGVPVVADHVGGLVGLSLLACGAVGGIAHGITMGERFNTYHWRKPQLNQKGGAGRRVYIPALDLMLKPPQARELLESSSRARALFGCRDSHCCPRKVTDTLENPARHFMYQRMREVSAISSIPEQLRPQQFLDRYVRPTTDQAVAAANINWQADEMAKMMRAHRKRMDALRVTWGDYVAKTPAASLSQVPKTRAVREGRG